MRREYDVLIVGGGPAGLSAALVLGRCCRKVLLCDAGRGRNHAARAVHNFLTREGVPPVRLRTLALAELRPYNVEIIDTTIVDAKYVKGGNHPYEIRDNRNRRFRGRKMLLATGVVDQLPEIPGIARFYGRSVFHCPYCDGWEFRGKHIVVQGSGEQAVDLVKTVSTWSNQLCLCTNGEAIGRRWRKALSKMNIPIIEEKITRLRGGRGLLSGMGFEGGGHLNCDALFFANERMQRSDLSIRLGCKTSRIGDIPKSRKCATRIPGLYVAGDASGDMQFVINAASEGATAAVAINKELQAAACDL